MVVSGSLEGEGKGAKIDRDISIRMLCTHFHTHTHSHILSVSTIGGGGGTRILSPRRSPKQPLPGIGLNDPLHGRQACPEFNSFHQGVGQVPGRGCFRTIPSRNGYKFLTSPSQSLNDSN